MKASSVRSIYICDPKKKPFWKFSSFDIQGKMWVVGFSVLFTMIVWFSAAYNWDFNPINKTKFSENSYGIIFDAGSTGSRVHIFKFLKTDEGKQMKLISDTFREIKPGLSAYADDPSKAAASLNVLLNLTKQNVPPEYWSSCPIALKATAGLRLLGDKTAKDILDKVEELFKKYPFKMTANNIEIMSGSDEGIFSWITVNYLENLLEVPGKTVVALDLGGGSTQITFVPSSPDTLQNAGVDFKKSVKVFGKEHNLYTHSYLGLGLMAARFGVMEKVTAEPSKLISPCIQANTQTTLTHVGVTYTVSPPASANSYQNCYASTSKFVTATIKPVTELSSHKIMAFSYFYDRAVDSNLIGMSGGNVTVEGFQTEAMKACTTPNSESPFLCLDLCYISALLKEGYILQPDKVIELTKRIQGAEVSWALGAVFDLFSTANVN